MEKAHQVINTHKNKRHSYQQNYLGTMLLASFILAIQTGAANAQERQGVRPNVNTPEDCYVIEAVEPENIYSFLRAQIQALSLAQKGEWANIKMLETEGGAPALEVDQTITGLREERIRNACAAFVVADYVNSENPNIAANARILADGYDELGKMSNQMLGINLQKFLRRNIGPSPQRQFSALIEKRRMIIKNMTEALNMSLKSLIDESRTNEEGKPGHLILDRDQVENLLDYLDVRFPRLKDSQGARPSGNFIKQAVSIQAFLTSGSSAANVP
jgi:hypothetical protein